MTDKSAKAEKAFARQLAKRPLASISRAAQRRYIATRPTRQSTRTGD